MSSITSTSAPIHPLARHAAATLAINIPQKQSMRTCCTSLQSWPPSRARWLWESSDSKAVTLVPCKTCNGRGQTQFFSLTAKIGEKSVHTPVLAAARACDLAEARRRRKSSKKLGYRTASRGFVSLRAACYEACGVVL